LDCKHIILEIWGKKCFLPSVCDNFFLLLNLFYICYFLSLIILLLSKQAPSWEWSLLKVVNVGICLSSNRLLFVFKISISFSQWRIKIYVFRFLKLTTYTMKYSQYLGYFPFHFNLWKFHFDILWNIFNGTLDNF
jgi:hypothetical protein